MTANYIQCYILNADLAPKCELLPNMTHFLSVIRKGALCVRHVQAKEKVIFSLFPRTIRIMGHQGNPTPEHSRGCWNAL